MKALWQNYSAKFLAITPREQYLILLTGVVAIAFSLYSFVIDDLLIKKAKFDKQISQIESSQRAAQTTIEILEQSLKNNPNDAVEQQIAQYQQKLTAVDGELLLLTSDLINPIQMRYALIDLLKSKKDVSLLSFEIIEPQALTLNSPAETQNANAEINNALKESEQSLTLYKHGIKLKLAGKYFALRDYLSALEQLKWKFFWQVFDYQLVQYPNSELTIEMYSLSTKKEFIGV